MQVHLLNVPLIIPNLKHRPRFVFSPFAFKPQQYRTHTSVNPPGLPSGVRRQPFRTVPAATGVPQKKMGESIYSIRLESNSPSISPNHNDVS